jgi:hypothetical protein
MGNYGLLMCDAQPVTVPLAMDLHVQVEAVGCSASSQANIPSDATAGSSAHAGLSCFNTSQGK